MFIGDNYKLSDQKESIFNSRDLKKSLNELVHKVNAVKRSNGKIKVKNQESVNPYDNKK